MKCTVALLVTLLSLLIHQSLASDCICPQCLSAKATKNSVYEDICCEESNLGKVVKIKKSAKNRQLLLCPKELPGSCSQGADDDGAKADCKAWYNAGYSIDGVYLVNPDDGESFKVYCDMTTSDGGWTVFQKRVDGSVSFYKNWIDYEHGFGNLEKGGEFWLGLDKINRLTQNNTNNTLRVDLWDFDNMTAQANYSEFGVGDSMTEYRLTVNGYSGTAGDSLTYHNGFQFTTKDNDNDIDTNSCAVHWLGAWWFGACHSSHLNGLYLGERGIVEWLGVIWNTWKGSLYSLRETEMKFRRN